MLLIKQKGEVWLLYSNDEPGFTSHRMKPLDKNNHLHLVSRFDPNQTAESYTLTTI